MFNDTNMQEQFEATKSWLQNMSEDELNELAAWLVENGYGVENQPKRGDWGSRELSLFLKDVMVKVY